MDRASASGAESRWFEPSRAYHNKFKELKVLLAPIFLPIKFIPRTIPHKPKGNQGKLIKNCLYNFYLHNLSKPPFNNHPILFSRSVRWFLFGAAFQAPYPSREIFKTMK